MWLETSKDSGPFFSRTGSSYPSTSTRSDPIGPDRAFALEAQQGNGEITGAGSGNVTNEFVNFVINWTNETRGAYNGAFDEQGFIHGSTFDVRHPGSFTGWHSSKAF